METRNQKTTFSKEKIEQQADLLLKRYPPLSDFVDVVHIARQEGFTVAETDFKDDTDGLIMVHTGRDNIAGFHTKKLIVIHEKRSYEFKRFIIAHELSHYFLDNSENESNPFVLAARDARHGRTDEENGHDYFAACLLMPKDTFAKRYQELTLSFGAQNQDIIAQKLSEIFVVPYDSVIRRIGEVKEA